MLVHCAVLMLVHCAVLMLVIVSMIEVFKTIAGIIDDLEKGNLILLVGALVAVLVPSGAVLFWGCSAIATELDLPIRKMLRYLRERRDKIFFACKEVHNRAIRANSKSLTQK
jgi:hypothetical protein